MPREPWVQSRRGARWWLMFAAGLVLGLGGALQAGASEPLDMGPPLDADSGGHGRPDLQLFMSSTPRFRTGAGAGREPQNRRALDEQEVDLDQLKRLLAGAGAGREPHTPMAPDRPQREGPTEAVNAPPGAVSPPEGRRDAAMPNRRPFDEQEVDLDRLKRLLAGEAVKAPLTAAAANPATGRRDAQLNRFLAIWGDPLSPPVQATLTRSRIDPDGGRPTSALALLPRDTAPDHLSPILPFQLISEGLQLLPSLALEHEVSLRATLNLTPSWELGLVVPTLPVHRVGAVARPLLVHTFGPGALSPSVLGDREQLGFGDLRLRSQYTVPVPGPEGLELGLFGQVRLPTGAQASQLGTRGMGSLALLTTSWQVGRVTPYASLGGGMLGGSPSAELLYSAGLEVGVLPGLSLALDGLGRWTPSAGGLQDHTIDLGLTWRSPLPFTLRAMFEWPLHQAEGLRASSAWTLRIDYRF